MPHRAQHDASRGGIVQEHSRPSALGGGSDVDGLGGKSIGEICRQLKDVNLNGGRDLALLQEHIAGDDLVGWAWNPGEGPSPHPDRSNWPDSS